MALVPNVPEHSDFQVSFASITKDGGNIVMTGIDRWTFVMGKSIDGVPLILKDSNGVSTSGDFAIDNGARSVTVNIASTEYDGSIHGASGGDGAYYIALYALDSSGYQYTHGQKKIKIEKQIVPSSVI